MLTDGITIANANLLQILPFMHIITKMLKNISNIWKDIRKMKLTRA